MMKVPAHFCRVKRYISFVAVVLFLVNNQTATAQLRSAFSPPLADAKQVVGAQAKITDQVRRVQANVQATLAALGRGAGITNLSVKRVVEIRADGAIQVVVWLTAVTNNELGVLAAQGVVVEASETRYMKAIRTRLTPSEINAVAQLPFVLRVSLPDYAIFNTGSVTSEGDVIHNADDVRNAVGGVDGTGVLVGVISDGIDTRNAAAATLDLPETAPGSGIAKIQINPTLGGSGDEGTAMLEIVHDLAPGASLAFSGPNAAIDMINSINWLAKNAEADVIVDDLSFLQSPYFEDGPIAKAAKDAVTMSGRCYISSAGNHAKKHHQT